MVKAKPRNKMNKKEQNDSIKNCSESSFFKEFYQNDGQYKKLLRPFRYGCSGFSSQKEVPARTQRKKDASNRSPRRPRVGGYLPCRYPRFSMKSVAIRHRTTDAGSVGDSCRTHLRKKRTNDFLFASLRLRVFAFPVLPHHTNGPASAQPALLLT